MVAAVPLMPELHGIAAWQADWISRGFKPPCIVIVVRRYNKALYRKVEEAFRSTLGKGKGLSLYEGDAKQLRDIAYVDLPSTVIVGVPGIGGIPIGEDWGADIWIDTYKPDRKTAGLKLQVSEAGCRKGRDNMYVLAWTITPQTSDIVGRILTLGFAKKGLEITAPTFNKSFEEFAKENDEEMKEKVNCVFFDFFTSDIAKAVVGLNPNMPKPVPL